MIFLSYNFFWDIVKNKFLFYILCLDSLQKLANSLLDMLIKKFSQNVFEKVFEVLEGQLVWKWQKGRTWNNYFWRKFPQTWLDF